MTTPQQLSDFIRSPHSPRQFLPDPIPAPILHQVLEDAQSAPSNSNTQPWNVHIASGATKERLTQAMIADLEAGRFHPDFNTNYGTGTYQRRSQELAASTYGVHRVTRDDTEGRIEVIRKNLRFYDAPHAVFLFIPMMGDGIRASGDLGMYAQNFLLSLTAHGYHGIPLASPWRPPPCSPILSAKSWGSQQSLSSSSPSPSARATPLLLSTTRGWGAYPSANPSPYTTPPACSNPTVFRRSQGRLPASL